MLDLKFIRENKDIVKNACKVKNFPDVVDDIINLDVRVRELKTITQTKTAEKNKISKEIPTATDKATLIAKSKAISEEIAADMAELAEHIGKTVEFVKARREAIKEQNTNFSIFFTHFIA